METFLLKNANGMEVAIIPYGGIITAIRVPDRHGESANIVLGLPSADAYQQHNGAFFGALIGRYANRIAGGRFTLDGTSYTVNANEGQHTLHGGRHGFDRQLWTVIGGSAPQGDRLVLSLDSPNGDQGFPGHLQVTVTYTLSDQNELRIDYRAVTDRPTVVNLTNHSYFNLAGNGSGDVYDQQLTINADRYTPVDQSLIPTGAIESVDGTPFDFRSAKPVGQDIRAAHPQILIGGGYDHNFVLNRPDSSDQSLMLAARAVDPHSGRILEVWTTEPGLQLYSGNFLNGKLIGSSSGTYRQGDGFCLETQHFPDSPNQPTFPTTRLNPGEAFVSTTCYRFSVAH